MSEKPPTPDAGRGDRTPTRRTEPIRDTEGETVYVEWYVNTPTSSWVRLRAEERGEEHRVIDLDSIEVPQAVRALRVVLDNETGGALIRDLDPMERVWVESEGGYVTIRTEEVRKPAEMLVLEESEARALLSAVELAKQEIGDVEDDPYV